jgi:hypothetical protein
MTRRRLRIERETGFEGEDSSTSIHPAREISESCTTGVAAGNHAMADACNDPLQPVAPADPIAEALDRVRAAWISDHDGRRLRRGLLRLLTELEG